MSGLTEELLKKPPYDENTADDIYVQALKEELLFHYRNNPAYRRFCDQKHFDPFAFSGDIEEIPPVYVSVFKELGRELCSVPDSDIKLTLQSSATSGVPSSIPVDSITAKRQRKAMIKVVGEYIGNERKPFMIMDVDPMSGFREILGARYAVVSGYLNFASSATYFLKVNEKKRYYYDTDEIKGYVDGLDTNQPVIVFGFTYILYSEIVLPLQRQGCSFRLPEGSRVIHIGGWKKLESEKVDKEIFNSVAADTFGISKDNVIDIYGFTEQMGLNYPDCRCGWKHTSVYSDVIVRDIATKEVLPAGREGLLEFVSPLPHSYPGNAVITDDIGMVEEGLCACGLKGKRFKVLGRLKKAEIRGCGDILSDKLKFTHNDSAESIKQGSFSFFYPAFSGQAADEPEQYISLLEKDLRAALVWLR